MWHPGVRMEDHWRDSPVLAFILVMAVIAFFWWGREEQPARLGQVLWPSTLLAAVWFGRERMLTRRITALAEAVEGA